jgi:small nuclear ribonucleoprotein
MVRTDERRGGDMKEPRPLDALNDAKGHRVLVELKSGVAYVGVLVAFDIHINIVLDDTEEKDQKGEVTRKLGRVLIRGDNVLLVSPT